MVKAQHIKNNVSKRLFVVHFMGAKRVERHKGCSEAEDLPNSLLFRKLENHCTYRYHRFYKKHGTDS